MPTPVKEPRKWPLFKGGRCSSKFDFNFGSWGSGWSL
jgi:hypothetical protein